VVEKQAVEAKNTFVTFSFRFFEIRPSKFCPTLAGDNYFKAFAERLRDICRMALKEVYTNNNRALRFHPIKWHETSEPNGFQNLPADLKSSTPFQMQITSNAHGRVHGFFVGALFHLVWIDPKHQLYPNK
jgi:hypothetical protein